MKKAIVTGGAGFIGSHLVSRLIDDGYEVVVIDNMQTACPQNVDNRAVTIKGDVSDPGVVTKLNPENVTVVFHLAAQSSGEISFEDPYADFKTNVGGTVLMLEWCRKHSVKRFIFTSSMAIYGTYSEEPLKETDHCSPTSFYGTAKQAAEDYIRLYQSLGIETTVIRPFNVYGSRQNIGNMKQGMASIYLAYLLKNEPVYVKGSLDRFRDQTHVSDLVEGIMRCLEKPAAIGQTYNIATGRKTTVRELVSTLLRVSGKPADYPVETGVSTPGDIFGCFADITKAVNDLDWQPKQSLESGLTEMCRYFMKGKT